MYDVGYAPASSWAPQKYIPEVPSPAYVFPKLLAVAPIGKQDIFNLFELAIVNVAVHLYQLFPIDNIEIAEHPITFVAVPNVKLKLALKLPEESP